MACLLLKYYQSYLIKPEDSYSITPFFLGRHLPPLPHFLASFRLFSLISSFIKFYILIFVCMPVRLFIFIVSHNSSFSLNFFIKVLCISRLLFVYMSFTSIFCQSLDYSLSLVNFIFLSFSLIFLSLSFRPFHCIFHFFSDLSYHVCFFLISTLLLFTLQFFPLTINPFPYFFHSLSICLQLSFVYSSLSFLKFSLYPLISHARVFSHCLFVFSFFFPHRICLLFVLLLLWAPVSMVSTKQNETFKK